MCKTLNRKYIYKYGEKKEDVEIVENMLNRMRVFSCIYSKHWRI